MPLVTRTGPQSQPKLHAIFRIALYGRSLPTTGRSPCAAAFSRAVRSGEAKRISRVFAPVRSSDSTGNRQERCWFCTVATSAPFSITVAAVSRLPATRSVRPEGSSSIWNTVR